ncbi:MAG: response regulator [Ktedonobacterales bacterium]|nr:response regulator [Ktedonobacterales bacterium]
MLMTPMIRPFPPTPTTDLVDAPLAERPTSALHLVHQPQVPGVTRQRYRAHVLLVDADPRARELLSIFLRRRGFRVWVAGNAMAAQAMLAHQLPDVLLLDTNLPPLAGGDLLPHLRRQRATALLPIIIVSPLGTARDIRHGLAQGADDYITKPVELSLVEARISALLRREARLRLAYGVGEGAYSEIAATLNE